MKQTAATRRTGEQLREKLGYILLFEISDPRLDLVTLTGAEVSVDRTYARVYVSCEPARYGEVMEALERARGRIRSLLARALDWRCVPELDFRIDQSTDTAEAIAMALKNVPATMAVEKDEEGYPVVPGGDGEGEPAGDPDAASGTDAPGRTDEGGLDA